MAGWCIGRCKREIPDFALFTAKLNGEERGRKGNNCGCVTWLHNFQSLPECQLAGSSENVCLLRRELFLPPCSTAADPALHPQSQPAAKIVYLINATSREPEVGILAEMQQGRKKKKKNLLGSFWQSTASSTCI